MKKKKKKRKIQIKWERINNPQHQSYMHMYFNICVFFEIVCNPKILDLNIGIWFFFWK